MSKRSKSKSRKKPNLSADVLERARREVYGGDSGASKVEKTIEAVSESDAPVKTKREKSKTTVSSGGYQQKRMLTSAELAEEYHYVIADLRSMAILAGILFVAMIVVSLIVI